MGKTEEARKILRDFGWGDDAIDAALNPTAKQARERPFIPVAQVNPEQHQTIRILHDRFGWGPHDIALAMPVPEREITRLISTLHSLEERLMQDWKDKHENE